MAVKITVDHVNATLASIRSLTTSQVLVGIPSTTAEREPDPEDPHPLSNAEIGYIHENGAPEANIPPRPFLVPGAQSAMPDVVDRYGKGAAAVLDGKVDSIDTIHDQVGLIVQNAVRRKITEGPFATLKESTLANRRARGRTGEKPLIDTGALRNAITYVIRPKG